MPTPAERKALLFLAGVIVLGTSVRVVRAARDDGSADAASRAALARQLAAVDSAHGAERAERAERNGRRAPTRTRRGAGRARGPGTDTTTNPPRIPERPETSDPLHPIPVIDLDMASESDIESLPRIGPVLARRIVEDRNTNGPFGSLAAFERVRGVGPALAASLQARVTFSGTARPSNAVVDSRLRSTSASSKSSRRERRK